MNRQLLEVLVSSSVLILALSAMRLVLRGKISPRLQYGLWLLAAVRLLVPVSIGESRASVMNYVPEQAMVQALEQTPAPVQRAQTPAAEPAAQPAAASAASDETPGSQTDAPDTMQAQQTQQVASQDTPHTQNRLSVLHVCYMLWGAGSALALAFPSWSRARWSCRRSKSPRCGTFLPPTKPRASWSGQASGFNFAFYSCR